MIRRYTPKPEPGYPIKLGPKVERFRQAAAGGLAAMSPEERRAYGEAVGKAIRARQASALALYPYQVRRSRTPRVWASMYREAMTEKHAAILAECREAA